MPAPRLPRLVALAAALVPWVASAQDTSLQMPASFVVPNYDRVFVGVAEAHEAGAYLARTRGPAAAWYDPAGIATVESTTVSVNVRGMELALLSPEEPLPRTAQVSAVGVLPLFVSCVLGPDVLPWRDVRLGFSGTEQTAWDSLVWWGASDATGHGTYVSDSSLSSYVLAGSLAWAAAPGFRLGGSLGVSWTRLYQNDRFSGLSASADAQGTIRTRLLSGLAFHAIPSMAVQWEPSEGLAIGAVARAPGLRIWGNATVQAERQDTSMASSQDTFLHTGEADFDWRYPLELQGGVALRRSSWEVELDARYHASAGGYTLLATDVPVQQVTVPPGGAPTTSPFAPIRFQGRAVVDVALGGSWAMSEALRLHGGVYAAPSPVAAGSSQFRQTDLYGLRAGVSFRGEKLSGSVGLGYETGRSSATPDLAGLPSIPLDEGVRTQVLSLTLAAEYRR